MQLTLSPRPAQDATHENIQEATFAPPLQTPPPKLSRYLNDPRSALRHLATARKDATWSARAAGQMAEIYLNPDCGTACGAAAAFSWAADNEGAAGSNLTGSGSVSGAATPAPAGRGGGGAAAAAAAGLQQLEEAGGGEAEGGAASAQALLQQLAPEDLEPRRHQVRHTSFLLAGFSLHL
jgi:hypothetical protein